MLYTEAQMQEHVEEILGLLYQIALRDSRIPAVLPQREFSEEAGLAVRAYQEAYGLPMTAGSDAHNFGDIRDFVVGTETPIESVADYIERVKDGRLKLPALMLNA